MTSTVEYFTYNDILVTIIITKTGACWIAEEDVRLCCDRNINFDNKYKNGFKHLDLVIPAKYVNRPIPKEAETFVAEMGVYTALARKDGEKYKKFNDWLYDVSTALRFKQLTLLHQSRVELLELEIKKTIQL
jgi:hypothetical protein